MLDAGIKEQLKAYMDKLQQPIELVAAYDDGDKSQELRQLLEELEPMSDKISLRTEDATDVRRPSLPLTASAPTLVCALPVFPWATSSPRWYWRCCR